MVVVVSGGGGGEWGGERVGWGASGVGSEWGGERVGWGASGVGECSVRNNGRTSDIYRLNKAFVRPFVISPDILSRGVAAFKCGIPYEQPTSLHIPISCQQP